jgi:hypothetical protein
VATQRLPLTTTRPQLPRTATGVRARLLSRRRRRLADNLERLVTAANEAPAPLSSVIPVQRAQVRAARTPILELASRLRGDDPVQPAGLILTRRLLTDGNGPAFAPSPPGALADAVEQAIRALDDVRAQPS